MWSRILKIGRQALELFFSCCGNGDMGVEITDFDGQVLRRLAELHQRPYLSIFGLFELERYVYGTREGQRIEEVPFDSRLQLPESKFSYLLQEWDQALAVQNAYAETNQTIARILGFKQSVDSMERTNRNMSEPVGEFFETQSVSPPAQEGEVVVASADGKGVCMRGGSTETQKDGSDSTEERNSGGKKMAVVGSVYTVAPYERSAEDVLEALFRKKSKDSTPKPTSRPKPQNKQVRASLRRDEADTTAPSMEEIFGWLRKEVQQRNPLGQNDVVVLMDGQISLWNAAEIYIKGVVDGMNVVPILDLLHAGSYVWSTAHLFYPKESQEVLDFTKECIARILDGKVLPVVRGLRWMGTHTGLSKKKQKKLEVICRYLQNNVHRMRYNEYLAAGYPIASGVIEGACRYLVKDRMERTGMRWVLDGAQSMPALRSIYLSGQWDEFTRFRIEKERSRLYPNSPAENAYADLAIAS
ncbi:ISKra4 family transposase ISRma1 [subsurface metagenome]